MRESLLRHICGTKIRSTCSAGYNDQRRRELPRETRYDKRAQERVANAAQKDVRLYRIPLRSHQDGITRSIGPYVQMYTRTYRSVLGRQARWSRDFHRAHIGRHVLE